MPTTQSSGVTLFSTRLEATEEVNILSRPTGVTIIAILAFFAAALLAFGACVFLVVGVAGMMGTDAGEPLSVAIAAMGVGCASVRRRACA